MNHLVIQRSSDLCVFDSTSCIGKAVRKVDLAYALYGGMEGLTKHA